MYVCMICNKSMHTYTDLYLSHSYVNFVPAALRRTEKSSFPQSRSIYIFHPSTSIFDYRTKNFTSYISLSLQNTLTIPIRLLITTFNHYLILQSHPSSLYRFISYISSPNLFIPLSFLSSPRRPSLGALPPHSAHQSTFPNNFTLAKTFPTPEVILSSPPSPIFSSHSPSLPRSHFTKARDRL